MSPHSEPRHDSYTISDLTFPFGIVDGLQVDDFREAASEIFFAACRTSPGFGGRRPVVNPSAPDNGGEGLGFESRPHVKWSGVGMAVTSRVKRALGLKMQKKGPQPSRRSSIAGTMNTGMVFTESQAARMRRPMTAAEIMRKQLRMSEEADNRLRKTLTRAIVGKASRRAETTILPLEMIRHLKPSEFGDVNEFHQWQKRKLKILEAALLTYPSLPLEKSDKYAVKFKDIIQASDTKPIDTGKNSEAMKALCNCVEFLARRSPDGNSSDACRWADGYPVNVYIYMALLCSIFDIKDETLVLDEVDELLELMKKAWPVLGIDRSIHNLCFFWVLFRQYVATGEVEPDLLGASLAVLKDVESDAVKVEKDDVYVKMLACGLNVVKRWSEKRLLNYHGNFDRGTTGLMETLLPLALLAAKILEDDVPCYVYAPQEKVDDLTDDLNPNRVDRYIRSSIRQAFAKMLEDLKLNGKNQEMRIANEVMLKLTRETQELAAKEKDVFSPVFRKWQGRATGIAAITLHACYGTLLKCYLMGLSSFTIETILVLQQAGKLEKAFVHMVIEESLPGEAESKEKFKDMVPYKVDLIILQLLKQWIQERLKSVNEYIQRSKETETWNTKSKTEPYAQSAVELVRLAKEVVENFFEIPVNAPENLVCDLTDGIELLFQDYVSFVASCGSKQNYLPTLPPLTRCRPDSKFSRLWKKTACMVRVDDPNQRMHQGENDTNPSTSRGTQRLYVRLNTLHYLLSQLHELDKIISLSPKVTPPPKSRVAKKSRQLGSSYFEHCLSAIEIASQHVSEVAAYRLMFLDANNVFYGRLYVGGVKNARIKPVLRMMRRNLTELSEMVSSEFLSLALKEVMKACFQAYLMVLLAGGNSRIFSRTDHDMIEEDFNDLKKVLCTCGEGLIVEDMVEREGEMVDGVVSLMTETTEQLVEDFTIVACEASGTAYVVEGQKLSMPPTTGKWNRSDPDAILRVLCHRNDEGANKFLKKTFQLTKRKI